MANSHPNSLTWRQSHLQLYSKLSTQFFQFLICLIPTEQTYICSQNSSLFFSDIWAVHTVLTKCTSSGNTPTCPHTPPILQGYPSNNAMTLSRGKQYLICFFMCVTFCPVLFGIILNLANIVNNEFIWFKFKMYFSRYSE